MLSRYDDIPFPDRNWYALVAYNMGPGAVNQIQKRIQAQGKDPITGSICMLTYNRTKQRMAVTVKHYSM